MTPFKPEPSFTHGQTPRTALLFCNLGTPASTSTSDVRRFLAEFLSDPRVVEIPRLPWWLILHGFILRFRPARSATKYARIWSAEGSPLQVWTQKQTAALQTWLESQGHDVLVRHAMRYGQDSISTQLDALKAAGATRILILPAYPQYSATTTASLFDAVYAWASRVRNLPELRFINRYHDDPGYLEALTLSIQRHWQTQGRPQRLVMSFHGVPERTLQLGDPYYCECQKTARLLAERLGLSGDQYQVTFQSRLGRARWLQPYTEPSLIALAQAGIKRVDVVCPGFTSDCLETLEEIDIEGRHAFVQAGGQDFHYIACVNADAAWIEALGRLSLQHLAGWPTHLKSTAAALAASRSAALALGAQH